MVYGFGLTGLGGVLSGLYDVRSALQGFAKGSTVNPKP